MKTRIVILMMWLWVLWLRAGGDPYAQLSKSDVGYLTNECRSFAIRLQSKSASELIELLADYHGTGITVKIVYEFACKNYLVEREVASRGTNAMEELVQHAKDRRTIATGASTPIAVVGNLCRYRTKNIMPPQQNLWVTSGSGSLPSV